MTRELQDIPQNHSPDCPVFHGASADCVVGLECNVRVRARQRDFQQRRLLQVKQAVDPNVLAPVRDIELMRINAAASPGGHSQRGSHRMAMVGQCHRKWWWRWICGLVPQHEFSYFVQGRLIHIALAYLRAIQMHNAGKQAPVWYYQRPNGIDVITEAGVGHPEAIELAIAIYVAYHNYYAGQDPWEPVAIEQEFFATLGQIRALINPLTPSMPDDDEVFSARIDLLVRNNGYLWAVDYKSTKHGNSRGRLYDFNPNGEYALHWQFLLQTAILKVNFGTEFRGVIVERILKSAPFDFSRSPVPIPAAPFRTLPDTLSRRAREEGELLAMADELELLSLSPLVDYLPDGDFWSCFSYGKPCEYRPLCTAEDALQLQNTVVREYHTGR